MNGEDGAREIVPARPAIRRGSEHPLAFLVATWFGVGLVPWAPGTFGTLAAVPLAFVFWHAGGPLLLAAAAVVIALAGVACSGAVVRGGPVHDPGHVVVDEVAGYLVACSLGPEGWRTAALAFVLFRVLDIWKPGPIQRLESLPGGWGVMADDLGAGALAGLLTWLAFGIAAGQWAGPFS